MEGCRNQNRVGKSAGELRFIAAFPFSLTTKERGISLALAQRLPVP